MRCNLRDDEAVINIAESLKMDRDHVVGVLHRLWSWAREQTTDGRCRISTVTLDRDVAVTGFCDAMVREGWLIVESRNVVFPNWDAHLAPNAAQRADNADRASRYRSRKRHANVTHPRDGVVTDDVLDTSNDSTTKTGGSGGGIPKSKSGRKPVADVIPEPLDTPTFRKLWSEWMGYKRDARKSLKPVTRKRQLERLAGEGVEIAIARLRRSMDNGWAGLWFKGEDPLTPARHHETEKSYADVEIVNGT